MKTTRIQVRLSEDLLSRLDSEVERTREIIGSGCRGTVARHALKWYLATQVPQDAARKAK